MKHAITLVLAISFCTPAMASMLDISLDAASMDANGVPFDPTVAAVRSTVRAKDTALTNVRFKVQIHSGTLGDMQLWRWSDSNNPWFGAAEDTFVTMDGGTEYRQGWVLYPPTQEWGPHFTVDPTPGVPGGEYEIFDTVPAGFTWDICLKLTGWDGSPIDLFSTAEGQMSSDQGTYLAFDSDPMPQTVPEPVSLAVLAIGSLYLFKRPDQV